MKIGIAKEIAAGGKERRAILLPAEVKKLIEAGNDVYTEKDLGKKIFISDDDYRAAGARMLSNRRYVFNKEIVVKLKPPLLSEFRMMSGNFIFSMLHAEQNPQYIEAMRKQDVKAIAMELIRNNAGERLIQCSHMGGEQGMIMAFHMAQKIPSDCKVLVIGYGEIASGAIKVAYNLGANVKILRKAEYKKIKHFIRNKDIIVNGISWPKEKRIKKDYLITKKMLPILNKGAVILDLSVDFPNPIQTCHPTQINKPLYEVDGIKHICIFGYPGLAPISSAKIYSKQVMPILLKLAACKKIEKFPKYIQRAMIIP